MKLGFDIHGVIDTFDVFPKLIEKLLDHSDVEVHVMSGLPYSQFEEQIGHLVDLSKVKHFSITDYLVGRPDVEVWWDDEGMPWADPLAWNRAKADYCAEMGIDVLFDDSPTYGKYFDDVDTVFCQIHNPARRKYRAKEPK
jgi:hypothetical protein